jgi:hypothetical protein
MKRKHNMKHINEFNNNERAGNSVPHKLLAAQHTRTGKLKVPNTLGLGLNWTCAGN